VVANPAVARENNKRTVKTDGVYVLHFDRRYPNGRQPGHYTGWSPNIELRVDMHRRGKSRARLMEVIKEAGIGFEVALVIEGATRPHERWLKRKGGAARYCPICQAERRLQAYGRSQEKLRREREAMERYQSFFDIRA
jgi:hypothetical protein